MPKRRFDASYWLDLVGKGRFIREHGRDAWNRIPPFYIRKYGKRTYLMREGYLDSVWLIVDAHR